MLESLLDTEGTVEIVRREDGLETNTLPQLELYGVRMFRGQGIVGGGQTLSLALQDAIDQRLKRAQADLVWAKTVLTDAEDRLIRAQS
jgi:hypothetical protein